MTPFVKMHGLGNDFVVFDGRIAPVSLTATRALAVADRRHGIGCDQVIVMDKGSEGADARMRIYNADGDEVESCGNAARCVARLLMNENDNEAICLETAGGRLSCTGSDGLVTVDMGVPRFAWQDIPLSEPRDTLRLWIDTPDLEEWKLQEAIAVNIGNPHCVFFVDDVEKVPIETMGSAIEKNSLFPQRTNVEFVQVQSSGRLRMRVWERGAGVTLACGTGACAAVAAAQRRHLCGTTAEVELDGGVLTIGWQGEGAPILMAGPTALTFRGEIDLDALA